MKHLGDPCIHCKTNHDDIAPGECPAATGLAALERERDYLMSLQSKKKADFEREDARLAKHVSDRIIALRQASEGLDLIKIALAETFLAIRGKFETAGSAKGDLHQAAIRFFAGTSDFDMSREYLGIKEYDRWDSQRCDCEYGMGPTHGHIKFSVGFERDQRRRVLTDVDREAAIYYLLNIEAIQASKVSA